MNKNRIERLGLADYELKRTAEIATKLGMDGSLSVRHLEAVVLMLQDIMRERMGGNVVFASEIASEQALFKDIFGSLIDLKYEHMEADLIARIGAGAVSRFCEIEGIKMEYMITPKEEVCEHCDGQGVVSTMEAVYPGEPHMAPVGERTCICQLKEEE